MDVVWRRVGMDEKSIVENREKAVEKMKDYVAKRQQGIKKVYDAVQRVNSVPAAKKSKDVDKEEKSGVKKKKKMITLD
jgi:hypothetical protein